jgi:2-keto-4-pentenoate hydratase/2-oxohepta-3-ene-1,7-dioic acid hydratase in catechol pathway
MRLARFKVPGGRLGVGIVREDEVAEVEEDWAAALRQCCGASPGAPTETGKSWRLDDCVLAAPLCDDSRVICTGMNYRQHEAEAGGLLRTAGSDSPVLFVKLAASMADPLADLPLDPAVSGEYDWEVELGVVIGSAGRDIAAQDVRDYVAGYTIVNDITARDLQRSHVQWFMGKNVRGSSPIGPWVTTVDEVGYPPALRLLLRVNGEEKQNATTTDMIFDIPALVSTTSRVLDLVPGDVFATGTPSGVGFARQPPEFLQAGDVIETEISGLGMLRNLVTDIAAPRWGDSVEEALRR